MRQPQETDSQFENVKPRKSLKTFHIITRGKVIYHCIQLILFQHVLLQLAYYKKRGNMITVSRYSPALYFSLSFETDTTT